MDASDLEALPLFSELAKKDRSRVAHWADDIAVEAGTELVKEGSFAHEFFAIQEGTAQVSQGGEPVAQLGPGDFFGEIALLMDDHHRTASVEALTPMRLVVMFQTQFGSMAEEMPGVADQLKSAILARWQADRAR